MPCKNVVFFIENVQHILGKTSNIDIISIQLKPTFLERSDKLIGLRFLDYNRFFVTSHSVKSRDVSRQKS